jgi:hypothetical protein
VTTWFAGDVMSGSVEGGDDHAGVLRELFGVRWWTGREFVLLVTAVFVLLPLVLRRRVGEFTSQYVHCYFQFSTKRVKLLSGLMSCRLLDYFDLTF